MQRFYKIAMRATLLSGLAVLVAYAATKPPATVEQTIQRMLMFDPSTRTLTPSGITASGDSAAATLNQAVLARESASAAMAISSSATNLAALTALESTNAAVWNIDYSQSFQTREPAAENQMAQVQWVSAINIAGVLYEDHYLEFSATPTESPGMVFHYRDQLGEEYFVESVTNSYPDLYPVILPSGVHSCYWFRCQVPLAFTNRLRRWNGAARFGGPEGSAYGLNIAGVFLVDDGNDIWQGRTFTAAIGSNTVEWIKGVTVAPMMTMMSEDLHERSILDTLAVPYRAARNFFQPPQITLISNTINKTTWRQGTQTYRLAFPVKEKK